MILEVKGLSKHFLIQRGIFRPAKTMVKALDNVSFSLEQFQSLGIVGESGSGKTTLAKVILRLILPTSGEVRFDLAVIKAFRKDVQIIFQNPYNSLDPRVRVIDTLAEPLLIHRIAGRRQIRDKALYLLKMTGLGEQALERYPIEFSGGQRQRICISRALASEPKFLVLDEPISSLDLTIQAQMLDLFLELKERLKLTYIFISHNLAIVKQIADRLVVMREGRIVEQGSCADIFHSPADPYTRILLEAARLSSFVV